MLRINFGFPAPVVEPGDDRSAGLIACDDGVDLAVRRGANRDSVRCPPDAARGVDSLCENVVARTAPEVTPCYDDSARAVGDDGGRDLVVRRRANAHTAGCPEDCARAADALSVDV